MEPTGRYVTGQARPRRGGQCLRRSTPAVPTWGQPPVPGWPTPHRGAVSCHSQQAAQQRLPVTGASPGPRRAPRDPAPSRPPGRPAPARLPQGPRLRKHRPAATATAPTRPPWPLLDEVPPAGEPRLGPANSLTGKPWGRYLRLGAWPVPPQHCRPLRHDHSAKVWAAGVGTRMWGPAACAGGGARRCSGLRLRLRGGAAAYGTASARAGHDGKSADQAARAEGGAEKEQPAKFSQG